MPVNPTYPGVYIDELPSAVRTIVGVPTSIAAFVGSAARGPVDKATHITSWGDFERQFGGLSASSLMSYAVFQFFQNGGSEAEIVRVVNAGTPATLDLGGGVTLEAKYPGGWGGSLRARVDYKVDQSNPKKDKLYNLTIRDSSPGGTEERYPNVEAEPTSVRSLDKVLQTSVLVKSTGALNARPPESPPATGGKDPFATPAGGTPATYVQAGPGNDGQPVTETQYLGSEAAKTGIYALLDTNIFNILCIPPIDLQTDFGGLLTAAATLCLERRAMFLVDASAAWTDVAQAVTAAAQPTISGDAARNAAVYFPRLRLPDPLHEGRLGDFPPSGTVAGIYARTDTQRGVWKAPAGIDASVTGAQELTVKMTDLENGQLNPLGINCIRNFQTYGNVVWGARTQKGGDAFADQWKYVPVRRTALFIEESLFRGTKWVVFEPNDEPLWAAIRLNVGAFMNSLFRQGAFQGRTPQEAYLVKCDKENNPQNDIDRGIVNILVGFAPLKPAEFVIIHIQQLAGQLQV